MQGWRWRVRLEKKSCKLVLVTMAASQTLLHRAKTWSVRRFLSWKTSFLKRVGGSSDADTVYSMILMLKHGKDLEQSCSQLHVYSVNTRQKLFPMYQAEKIKNRCGKIDCLS